MVYILQRYSAAARHQRIVTSSIALLRLSLLSLKLCYNDIKKLLFTPIEHYEIKARDGIPYQ